MVWDVMQQDDEEQRRLKRMMEGGYPAGSQGAFGGGNPMTRPLAAGAGVPGRILDGAPSVAQGARPEPALKVTAGRFDERGVTTRNVRTEQNLLQNLTSRDTGMRRAAEAIMGARNAYVAGKERQIEDQLNRESNLAQTRAQYMEGPAKVADIGAQGLMGSTREKAQAERDVAGITSKAAAEAAELARKTELEKTNIQAKATVDAAKAKQPEASSSLTQMIDQEGNPVEGLYMDANGRVVKKPSQPFGGAVFAVPGAGAPAGQATGQAPAAAPQAGVKPATTPEQKAERKAKILAANPGKTEQDPKIQALLRQYGLI